MGLSVQHFQEQPQKIGSKNYLTWRERCLQKVSSRTMGLFGRFYRLHFACWFFLAISTQLFSQNLSSNLLSCCLSVFSTTSSLYSFWRSKILIFSSEKNCSRDDTFSQIRTSVLPITLASSLNPLPSCGQLSL